VKTVLVIEDNEKNMKLFRDLLQFNGYRTLEAMTGRDGLALAVDRRPDLVLLDIQLPDIDGVAVLRGIREQIGPGLKVLAVSASVMPDDLQRILASGFDGFITKPINIKGFATAVREALEDRP
jgi:two-component system cell cycle response regulator DivK